MNRGGQGRAGGVETQCRSDLVQDEAPAENRGEEAGGRGEDYRESEFDIGNGCLTLDDALINIGLAVVLCSSLASPS